MITKIDTLTETVMMAAHKLCKRVIKCDSPKHRIVDVLVVQECKDLLALIEKRDIMIRESVTNPQLFTLPGCVTDDTPIRTDAVGPIVEQRPLGPKTIFMGGTISEEAIDREVKGSQEEKINDNHCHYQKQGF